MMSVQMSNFRQIPFRRTARLYAIPSFVGGSVRVLDLGVTLNEYNENLSVEEADFQSILSDWFAIGDDFRYAINSFVANPHSTENMHVS